MDLCSISVNVMKDRVPELIAYGEVNHSQYWPVDATSNMGPPFVDILFTAKNNKT